MCSIKLELAGIKTAVPANTQYRVENPCSVQHGSIGGWIKDDSVDQGFTILWRPLGLFVKSGQDSNPHTAFRDTIIRNIRRETHGFTILDSEEAVSFRNGDHSCDVLQYRFVVRKSFKKVDLIRRQMLWTCEESGRHIAFEVTTARDDFHKAEPLWNDMFAEMTCHTKTLVDSLT